MTRSHLFRTVTFLFCLLAGHSGLSAMDWIALDASPAGTPPTIQVVESDAHHTRLRIILHGFWISDVEAGGLVFQLLAMDREGFLRETGKAQVPSIGRLLGLPVNRSAEYTIVDGQVAEFPGILIFPAQPKPNRCGDATDLPFTMDPDFYAADEYYPGRLITVTPPAILRDRRVSRFGIYPFQFNPARQTVEVYHDMLVDFHYSGKDYRALPLTPPGPVSPAFQQLYRAAIINEEWLDRHVKEGATARERMLILVADDLAGSIADYVQWKKESGLAVTVRLMSEVGTAVADIQSALQAAYDDPATRPTYVLFVGDENSVPPDYRSTSNGSAASDYPYTLLSGGDILPDLWIGRLVGDTPAEIAYQADKIIHYEKHPDTGAAAGWYAACAGIASDEGSAPSDEEYITAITDTLIANTYTWRDHWFQGDGTATAANINAGLNDGRTWLTYIGHGSGTSWGSTNTYYGLDTISQLTNDYRMPILVDVACLNGQFDGSSECFGERWMRADPALATPKGAVGYLGGSVSISWDPPAIMAQGIARHHFEDPVYTFGGSYWAGQLHLLAENGSGSDTIDNFEWFILFGDPSLLWRTVAPAVPAVSHPEQMFLGQASLAVSVSDGGGAPLSGLRVTAFSSAQTPVQSFGLTDDTGQVNLAFPDVPTLPGDLRITVTGYNLAPYQMSIPIVSGEPCDPPTAFDVENAGDNDVLLSWTPSPHSLDGYKIYRSTTGAGGPFQLLAEVPLGSTYHDRSVSGGLIYWYKMKTVCQYDGVDFTECLAVTAVGECRLEPVFGGVTAVTAPSAENCRLELAWDTAQSACVSFPGITYNVYRSLTADGLTSLIASGVVGTTYADTTVQSDTRYYYTVRAVDSGGNEDTNSVRLSGIPSGPPGVFFDDDMESGTNGWTSAAVYGTDDWRQVDNVSRSPSHSWFSAASGSLKDVRLMMPPVWLGAGAEMSFWHRYYMEDRMDGCVLEISTNGGASYSDLGGHILSGGYNATMNSSGMNPIGGQMAWTGMSAGWTAGDWTRVRVDLSAFAETEVVIRFRLCCNQNASDKVGWYVDDVSLSQYLSCNAAPVQMGDLNLDGQYDAADLSILSHYLTGSLQQGAGAFVAPLEAADLKSDGIIDAADLTVMLLEIQ